MLPPEQDSVNSPSIAAELLGTNLSFPLAFVYEIAVSRDYKAVTIFQRLPAYYRQHDPTDAWSFSLEQSARGAAK